MMDKAGNKAAAAEIAMIKVKAPQHGAADHRRRDPGAWRRRRQPGLRRWPRAGPGIRTLRLADGPDEVHNRSIAGIEFSKHRAGRIASAMTRMTCST